MAPAHRVVLARIIHERFYCQLQASFLKRISSFDYAQDGGPAEPYLANKDVIHALSVLRIMRHGIRFVRFTGTCIQAISRQTVMNNMS
jgi:hypothetical protein